MRQSRLQPTTSAIWASSVSSTSGRAGRVLELLRGGRQRRLVAGEQGRPHAQPLRRGEVLRQVSTRRAAPRPAEAPARPAPRPRPGTASPTACAAFLSADRMQQVLRQRGRRGRTRLLLRGGLRASCTGVKHWPSASSPWTQARLGTCRGPPRPPRGSARPLQAGVEEVGDLAAELVQRPVERGVELVVLLQQPLDDVLPDPLARAPPGTSRRRCRPSAVRSGPACRAPACTRRGSGLAGHRPPHLELLDRLVQGHVHDELGAGARRTARPPGWPAACRRRSTARRGPAGGRGAAGPSAASTWAGPARASPRPSR